MATARNPRLLLNAYFITALTVLVCNDHLWKFAYANALTGKLSDLAGLVLLPLVICFLIPPSRERAIWWAALFFIFWKTPWSGPVISWYNDFAPIPISRIVDYSDFWALLVLPLPYWLIRRYHHSAPTPVRLVISSQSLAGWSLLLVTSLSFIATSPPLWYSFQQSSGNVTFYDTRYRTGMTQSEVLGALSDRGVDYLVDTAFANNIHLRRWINGDSLLAHDPPFYRIPQLIVDEDTLHEVQFSLMPLVNGKVMFLLNGLQVKDIPDEGPSRKLRRMYRRVLKRELAQKGWKK